jgi:integrase/recombinase XerC
MTAEMTSRARMARRQAASLGLRMRQRGSAVELRDAEGLVLVGALSVVETYIGERYVARRPGPAQAAVPLAWRQPINDYCLHAAAAGLTISTISTRRKALGRMDRELQCPPAEVTAELIVTWFGRQQWKPETRRAYRSVAREFFRWAYRTGRVPAHIADDLPAVRTPLAVARPVPDDAWIQSLAAADARVALMMRLAAEAGLRRAEVAQVHTSDIIQGHGGAQLVVHGKGGKTRVVPISDALAATLQLGAKGHTPYLPVSGWLFPAWPTGGHLTAHYVGKLVADALPPGWSMHKLRHRFATRAYRGSRNLRAVQTLLGHASIATTERYTAVDDDEIRAAMMAAVSD